MSQPPHAIAAHGRGNGIAVAAFVTGLLAPLFAVVPPGFLFSLPLSVLGVVFGAIGLRRANADPARGGKGLAIAGLVLGAIGIALFVTAVALFYDALTDL